MQVETYHSSSEYTTNTEFKSPYYDYGKLQLLTQILNANIEELINHFDLELQGSGNMRFSACPIHGGDRFNAFNLYSDGGWKCRTRNCHDHFKGTTIGMVRGLLSHAKYEWAQPGDRQVSWIETIEYLLNLFKTNWDDLKVDEVQLEKMQFIRNTKIVSKKKEVKSTGIARTKIQAALNIPSPYFLSRGFSAEVLRSYDVGECINQTKEMKHRAVVPVYDKEGIFVGCTGRSLYEKCQKCNLFHNSQHNCPDKAYSQLYAKWKFSEGFKAHEYLYNLCNAQEHIANTNTVILVESPGNIWRLVESGIKNCVGLFGASLSELQKFLLDGTGALRIIVIGDNDPAGLSLFNSVKTKCDRTYKLEQVKLPEGYNDLGDMSIEDIKEINING